MLAGGVLAGVLVHATRQLPNACDSDEYNLRSEVSVMRRPSMWYMCVTSVEANLDYKSV